MELESEPAKKQEREPLKKQTGSATLEPDSERREKIGIEPPPTNNPVKDDSL